MRWVDRLLPNRRLGRRLLQQRQADLASQGPPRPPPFELDVVGEADDRRAVASLASDEQPRRSSRTTSAVEAAFRQVDAALDQPCATLGLKPAA
jgi:hypothetical protein